MLALCLMLLPTTLRAEAATFVDLHFEPYVFDGTLQAQTDTIVPGRSWCVVESGINFETNRDDKDLLHIHLFGTETLPEGVDPSSISVTRLQWSPGNSFDSAQAHDFDLDLRTYWVKWKNEEARLAEVFINNYAGRVVPEMEEAGLKNTDPFTVRATQNWGGISTPLTSHSLLLCIS